MKLNIENTGIFGLLLAFTASLSAADLTHFAPQPGSKVRLEGTSTVHDWQVEGTLIGGSLDVGAGFPIEPGQSATPAGKVEAKADVFIPVRSLHSVEKDGKPYSDKMNDVMYEKMKLPTEPKIFYHLDELTLKALPQGTNAPYVFDSAGELAVAGVTNKISMPITITPLGDKKLKVSGNTTVKMTQFSIQPPVLIGILKTGDDVKISFDWMVGQKAAAAVK